MDKVIWFDFENAPHCWVLKEIISYFQNKGIKTLNTARDFSYTIRLSEYLNIKIDKISSYKTSRTKTSKLLSVIARAMELRDFIKDKSIKPTIAISHGSRSQALAAWSLRIPVFSLDDYEYSARSFNHFVNSLLTPFPIPKEAWGKFHKKVIHYPGLKEELYLWNKDNYLNSSSHNGFEEKINIVFRPEGRFTHYSSIKSKMLQDSLIEHFANIKDAHIILLARDKIQEKEIEKFFQGKRVSYSIPQNVLNGPSLLYNADLVIGGGGTMTRESSILETPSYSFFGGQLGHVDKYLVEKNKLVLLGSVNDIEKIKFEKKTSLNPMIKKDAFDFIINYLNSKINGDNY